MHLRILPFSSSPIFSLSGAVLLCSDWQRQSIFWFFSTVGYRLQSPLRSSFKQTLENLSPYLQKIVGQLLSRNGKSFCRYLERLSDNLGVILRLFSGISRLFPTELLFYWPISRSLHRRSLPYAILPVTGKMPLRKSEIFWFRQSGNFMRTRSSYREMKPWDRPDWPDRPYCWRQKLWATIAVQW
jgi:hypothetical protein